MKRDRKLLLTILKLRRLITMRDVNLQVKIIICYFLVGIPIIFVGNNFYTSYSDLLVDNSLNAISQVNRQTSEKIDAIIEQAENYTLLFQHIEYINTLFFGAKKVTPGGQDFQEQSDIYKEFERREGANFFFNEKFYSIDIYDSNRNRVYSISKEGLESNFSDPSASWFNRVVALKGGGCILNPYMTLESRNSQYYFSYARSILKTGTLDEVVGVVVINMDIKILDEIISANHFGQGSDILILAEDSKPIFSKASGVNPRKKSEKALLSLREEKRFKAEYEGVMSYINYHTSAKTGWKIVSVVPVSIISNQLAPVWKFTVALISLCILGALILTVFISYRITRSLKKLSRVMTVADYSKVPQHISIHSRDEIGQMGRSYNRMIRRINDLINSVYKVQIKEKQTKLEALQMQINPHFLYNTLETIRMLADIHDDFDVAKISEVLGRILRYSIENFNAKATIGEEMAHLRNYVFIQNYRFSNKFEVIEQIDEQLLSYPVIKLIVQPIVENAIYHGLERKPGLCRIIISIYRKEEMIFMDVEDNGYGMDESQVQKVRNMLYNVEDTGAPKAETKRKSIGLKNVNERIKLCYGEKYGLEVESQLNVGTRIRIFLPYEPVVPDQTGGVKA